MGDQSVFYRGIFCFFCWVLGKVVRILIFLEGEKKKEDLMHFFYRELWWSLREMKTKAGDVNLREKKKLWVIEVGKRAVNRGEMTWILKEQAWDLEKARWYTFEKKKLRKILLMRGKESRAWSQTISKYDYELLLSRFHTILLSFLVAFLSINLWISVDIKGHLFVWLDLIVYMHVLL